mmetsp:Transcript_7493/g.6718  ORF Transcript_7493/g.6718 Transcript_7493/m.6718 type:complete len:157 (-) Transcript_7493:43-513(-)
MSSLFTAHYINRLRIGDGLDIHLVMQIHSLACMVLGGAALSLPHSLYSSSMGSYNHMSHEFIRLYGCLTLAVGWLVHRCRSVEDGRLHRNISESFGLCYILQSLAMLRAQFTDPSGHSLLHWSIALLFLSIGTLYLYIRITNKIKYFELPNNGSKD